MQTIKIVDLTSRATAPRGRASRSTDVDDVSVLHAPAMTESSSSWRRSLGDAVRSPDELCDLLDLPMEFREQARRAAESFPIVVPRSYLRRIERCNPNDPLLRQVLPIADEMQPVAGFRIDPVGDLHAEKAPGLLQKYSGRALFVLTGVCAIHCRYCFRRHFPYDEGPTGFDAWQPAFDAIAADPTIEEAILSGGDPLTRTDAWLARFVRQLESIPHLRRLRIHTRLPIVLPDRVDADLVDWLGKTRLTPVVVVHANHPNELDAECSAALTRLARTNAVLLNQSVLLRGVNDSAAVLADLSRRLLDCRVTPYYLHQLDRVHGGAHFEVPEPEGRAIVAELRRRLPGYAVPRYVREIEGADSKVDIPIE